MSDNTKAAASAAITNWNSLIAVLRLTGAVPAEIQRVLTEVHDELMPILKWAVRYGEWPQIDEGEGYDE